MIGTTPPLGWGHAMRLGLVQIAIGATALFITSTLNRIMVVELAFPALLPGALVALHYLVQLLRPRFGYESDRAALRSRWILWGLCVLAAGTVAAAVSTASLDTATYWAVLGAVLAYIAIGFGMGAAGTSLLALLAEQVAPERRAACATLMWIMMIAGFGIGAALVGATLRPYSTTRLVMVGGVIATLTVVLGLIAVGTTGARTSIPRASTAVCTGNTSDFRTTLAAIWAEPVTRRFTWFVLIAMLAYSGQELILEPFAGLRYALTPAASASINAGLHGGALVGMVSLAVLTSLTAGRPIASLRLWRSAGCIGSALALLVLAAAGMNLLNAPFRPTVIGLGFCNGVFAVASIGSMMDLAAAPGDGRQGVRLGLWGGAQALAFAFGGFAATGASDAARAVSDSPGTAYAAVFFVEAALFVMAAFLGWRLSHRKRIASASPILRGTRLQGATPK